MTKNIVYFGIVLLAIIAAVLGYNIYKQQTMYQQTTVKPTSAPSTKVSPSKPTSTTQPSVDSRINEDRKIITNYPGVSASDVQKKEFSAVINKYAQTSDTLNITGCNTLPMVLQTKKGADIKLVNDDTQVRSVMLGGGKQYDVPIKGTKTIKVDFKNMGVNLYRCNLPGNPITGAFLVRE